MQSVNNKYNTIVSDFSLRFRLLMSYHNLTLKQIADFTQNATSTVGTWKNGRIPSSPETLSRLAELFHVSEEFLLYGKKQQAVPEGNNASEQILRDIELLVAELDKGNTGNQVVEESVQSAYGNSNIDNLRMSVDIRAYLEALIKEAGKHPGGLQHIWYQLRHELPLSLYRELEQTDNHPMK